MSENREIEKQLKTLVATYRQNEFKEWWTLAVKMWNVCDGDVDRLRNVIATQATATAASSASTWSGGHTVMSMLEQIKHEVALHFAQQVLRVDFVAEIRERVLADAE